MISDHSPLQAQAIKEEIPPGTGNKSCLLTMLSIIQRLMYVFLFFLHQTPSSSQQFIAMENHV